MALEEQCSAPPQWRSISLTHVEFPEGDLTGNVLAYISLLPIAILVGFVTLIVFKRELHTISFFGGLILNEGVNWLLKNILREPGPHAAPINPQRGCELVLLSHFRMHQTNNARCVDLLWRHILSIILLGVAFSVSYSRPISEYFLVRDTSLIPNILWFEYTVTRSEARNRQRKLGTKLQ
uniref:Dolichyldiphosphatase 1 n=1 Tax=Labrus bergylta TaxID=56723 RepID=A0A3Q3GJW7_9LABR